MSFALLFDLCGILQICLIDNSTFCVVRFLLKVNHFLLIYVGWFWKPLKAFELIFQKKKN